MKKILSILLVLLMLSFGGFALVSCGSPDSDGDGFTDDFEDEHSDKLDKDSYTWNEDIDW